jgi:hypothetical protein
MGFSEKKPPFGVQIKVPAKYKLLDLLGIDPVSETSGLETH